MIYFCFSMRRAKVMPNVPALTSLQALDTDVFLHNEYTIKNGNSTESAN
ncbi:hypothetical protein [Flavobacterium crassostreae]|nr:hypothetical protein [Flavobacterium crassostreae]